jgi:predicted aspartyl protease
MGEIRTTVKLANAVDTALVSMVKLTDDEVRRIEVEGIVDTGAVASILPVHVADKLGLITRGHRVAKYADGRTETVGVTTPVLWEILGRDTVEEALVLGDEVLIGQTVLERLDLLANCSERKLMPHPDRPNQPVLNVRSRRVIW